MPISPDSDYSLMGAVACLDITSDIYHGAFVAQLDVDGICDGTSYRTFGPTIEQAVLQWYETASLDQRFYVVSHGLLDVPMQIEEVVATVVNSLARNRVRASGLPLPPIERMFGEHFWHYPVDIPSDAMIDGILAETRLREWAGKLGEQFQRMAQVVKQIDDIDRYLADMSLMHVRYGSNVPNTVPVPVSVKPSRREQRQVRRVINRGIRAYTKFFGGKDIQAFISNGQTLIEGVRFNYLLANHGNILDHSRRRGDGFAVPYGLTICNKGGEKLATACIYIPNTPIIDQILALSLNVKHEESEKQFLRTANLSTITEAPIELAELMPPRAEQMPPRDDDPRICRTPDETNYYEMFDRARDEFMEFRGSIEQRIQEFSGIPAERFAVMCSEQRDFRKIARIVS